MAGGIRGAGTGAGETKWKNWAMPNQRKDGKTNKNVWLTRDERILLTSVREALGLKTDTETIKRAIEELAKARGLCNSPS